MTIHEYVQDELHAKTPPPITALHCYELYHWPHRYCQYAGLDPT